MGVDAPEVLVERKVALHCGRLGGGNRYRQDGVGPQSSLVVGAVQVDHGEVHGALVIGLVALEGVVDLAVHVVHRRTHSLAPPLGATVAKFNRLVNARRGTAGRNSAAERSRLEMNLGFDRGVPTRIQNLTS